MVKLKAELSGVLLENTYFRHGVDAQRTDYYEHGANLPEGARWLKFHREVI